LIGHHGPVKAYLIAVDGSEVDASREAAVRLFNENKLLWLDLFDPDDETLDQLSGYLGVHPLATKDAQRFGQRPKIEDYDGFTQIVAYGVHSIAEPLVEVHCFYAEHYLVTVRKADCAAFADVRETLKQHEIKRPSRIMLLYRLLSELTDGFFPVLSDFDDRIDQVQDAILAKPTDQQLADLFTMKRWLIMVRKVITPQRDMIASVVAGVTELPGMTREVERYFRELYDHLIRISDLVDSYRDLLSGSLDSYLSVVSNRLNQVTKQLTIIATIFLPLSFLTGFFGQNFGWMVDRLTSLGVFLGLGIGTEVLAVVLLLWLFRRRGWF
jgi:magnesium transporter